MAKLLAVDSVSGKALMKGGRLCTRCCTTPCLSDLYVIGIDLTVIGGDISDWNDCITGLPACSGTGFQAWTSNMGFSGNYTYVLILGFGVRVRMLEDTLGAVGEFFYPTFPPGACPFPDGDLLAPNITEEIGGFLVFGDACAGASLFAANADYAVNDIVQENPPDFVFGGDYVCISAYNSGPTPELPPNDPAHWLWAC